MTFTLVYKDNLNTCLMFNLVETMDMGLSHWNNHVSATDLISIGTVLRYLLYKIRYFIRNPDMIYVRTLSHTLNNVLFLVSDMSKEHGRLITQI